MKIRFVKTTPTHHTFEILRDDGTDEKATLETKSLMPHDLIHYAYESLAGCTHSFYGLLASGTPLKELDDREIMKKEFSRNTEMVQTEMIVGPLSSYLKEDTSTLSGKIISEEIFLAGLENIFSAHSLTIPAYMTPEFLKDLKGRYRTLVGQWKATPHGKVMEIVW
jgi:hypothetical protein